MIVSHQGPVHTSSTSFSACSGGLEAVYGQRPTLTTRVCRRIINTILPETLIGQQEGNSAFLALL